MTAHLEHLWMLVSNGCMATFALEPPRLNSSDYLGLDILINGQVLQGHRLGGYIKYILKNLMVPHLRVEVGSPCRTEQQPPLRPLVCPRSVMFTHRPPCPRRMDVGHEITQGGLSMDLSLFKGYFQKSCPHPSTHLHRSMSAPSSDTWF